MQYSYEYNGAVYTVQLERQADGSYRAKIADREYHVEARSLPHEATLIRLNGQSTRVDCASAKRLRYAQSAGIQYTLEKSDPQARKRSKQAGAGSLSAQMPGQVVDVRVQVGELVTHGQVLVVLEAMKMEIRVVAPHAGIVEAVKVGVGAVVERGQLLVELRES